MEYLWIARRRLAKTQFDHIGRARATAAAAWAEAEPYSANDPRVVDINVKPLS
jgi:hypothetical protein